MTLKGSHSKLDNLKYNELKMQPYLSSNNFYKNDAQLLFKLRTRMAKFKANFKKGNTDLSCLNCGEEDRQDHILSCDPIVTKFPETKLVKYQTIFSNNPKEISKTLKVIKKALNHREKSNNVD